MQTDSASDWAEGLHLTVTGLSKDQRQQVRDVVEAAGGRLKRFSRTLLTSFAICQKMCLACCIAPAGILPISASVVLIL